MEMAPLQAELARLRKASLASSVDDVDRIIELLVSAREQVAGGTDNLLPLPPLFASLGHPAMVVC